jgi:hypothetical protein
MKVENIRQNLIGVELFGMATLRGNFYAKPALVSERVLVGWCHWVGDCYKIDPLA